MEGSSVVRKGAWTKEEDNLLRECIHRYGEGKWHQIPSRAGLNRCRKSCRLRWLNYLKPNIKKGEFADDEVDLMVRLHKLLGNRWSLIAGRIPGRTANGVKNYWNTHLRRDYLDACKKDDEKENAQKVSKSNVIKPHPRNLSKRLRKQNGNTESTHIPAAGNHCSPREDENIRWETWLNYMGVDRQQVMNVSSRPSTDEKSLGKIMMENWCSEDLAIGNNWNDLISFDDDDLLNLFNGDHENVA